MSIRDTSLSLRDTLERTLQDIEEKTGKQYTLTLHEIGKPCNDDLQVGDVDHRKCRWKVEIFPERKLFCWEENPVIDHEPYVEPVKPTEQVLFKLNGIYDSYDDIRTAIVELRLSHAVEMGNLKSFQKFVGDKVEWELTCGVCGHTTCRMCPV